MHNRDDQTARPGQEVGSESMVKRLKSKHHSDRSVS